MVPPALCAQLPPPPSPALCRPASVCAVCKRWRHLVWTHLEAWQRLVISAEGLPGLAPEQQSQWLAGKRQLLRWRGAGLQALVLRGGSSLQAVAVAAPAGSNEGQLQIGEGAGTGGVAAAVQPPLLPEQPQPAGAPAAAPAAPAAPAALAADALAALLAELPTQVLSSLNLEHSPLLPPAPLQALHRFSHLQRLGLDAAQLPAETAAALVGLTQLASLHLCTTMP